jgi:hypothetical protein
MKMMIGRMRMKTTRRRKRRNRKLKSITGE